MTSRCTTELEGQWREAVGGSGVTGVRHDLASAGVVGTRGLGRVSSSEYVVGVSMCRYVRSRGHDESEDAGEAVGRELEGA